MSRSRKFEFPELTEAIALARSGGKSELRNNVCKTNNKSKVAVHQSGIDLHHLVSIELAGKMGLPPTVVRSAANVLVVTPDEHRDIHDGRIQPQSYIEAVMRVLGSFLPIETYTNPQFQVVFNMTVAQLGILHQNYVRLSHKENNTSSVFSEVQEIMCHYLIALERASRSSAIRENGYPQYRGFLSSRMAKVALAFLGAESEKRVRPNQVIKIVKGALRGNPALGSQAYSYPG